MLSLLKVFDYYRSGEIMFDELIISLLKQVDDPNWHDVLSQLDQDERAKLEETIRDLERNGPWLQTKTGERLYSDSQLAIVSRRIDHQQPPNT